MRRSVPAIENCPASNTISCSAASKCTRGDLLAALDQAIGGDAQRIASGDDRAAAEGAGAEFDHVRYRHSARGCRRGSIPSMSAAICAKAISCPCPCECVPMISVTAPVESNLISALSGNGARRRPRRNLDRIGDADAAQLAALLGFRLALAAKPCQSASCERVVHVALELAGIVGEDEFGVVGHLIGRDQVAAPQFHRIEAAAPAPRCRSRARWRRSPPAVRRRDRARSAGVLEKMPVTRVWICGVR